jgi:hypothetical protein
MTSWIGRPRPLSKRLEHAPAGELAQRTDNTRLWLNPLLHPTRVDALRDELHLAGAAAVDRVRFRAGS